MKFCRIRTAEGIVPAAIDDTGTPRSLSGLINDLTSDSLDSGALDSLIQADLTSLPTLENPDYAPILPDIRRIFCIGLNYSDHAAEAGLEPPTQPIVFMKVCPATGANLTP